jgi:hypothetical protein
MSEEELGQDEVELPADSILCYFTPSVVKSDVLTGNSLVQGYLHIVGQTVLVELPLKDLYFKFGAL